jgi:hypothetical protein
MLFEEKASSPVAFIAELTPWTMVTLDKRTAVTPTIMSKTVKIRISRAQYFFVHLALAL